MNLSKKADKSKHLKIYIVCILINSIISVTHIIAQKHFPFPIDTVDITGNFGEIRNNHFHQGIDFSTKGIENYPVKSIEDGYVYRIKISSTGYGKALYIHHPSGLLSVYAHLNQFSDNIQSRVNTYLISHQTNEVDIFLKKDSIPVKKNETIGFSGNTGSSTGPHLHFEIRDELTEIPINPLFYFDNKDTIKPHLHNILFYNLTDTITPIPILPHKKQQTAPLLIPSISGVAISATDKTRPNGNPNNIYKVQLFLDGKKIYQHRLHHITFDNTIYVEYYSDKIKNQIYQKCFATHLYPPFFYDTLINKGRIILQDTNVHELKIILCDEKNNCLDTTLHLQSKTISSYKNIYTKQLILCEKNYHLKTKYFELSIPEKSLYHDIKATVRYNSEKKKIEFSHTPLSLKFPAKCSITHQLPYSILNKTLLISNKTYYLPDTFTNKKIEFSVHELSNYYLYSDNIPPLIQPKHYNKKRQSIILPSNETKLFFTLSDNTKIKEYKVYFNNQFCISYYYAAKKLLVIDIPEERIATDENYIQIIATDLVGNITQKNYKLIFK